MSRDDLQGHTFRARGLALDGKRDFRGQENRGIIRCQKFSPAFPALGSEDGKKIGNPDFRANLQTIEVTESSWV